MFVNPQYLLDACPPNDEECISAAQEEITTECYYSICLSRGDPVLNEVAILFRFEGCGLELPGEHVAVLK